ncbi:hypothetical protein LUU34_01154100 [Aix galericulata]|nr:hypothetical protein LUU34_01154100 [Aix galericulata]
MAVCISARPPRRRLPRRGEGKCPFPGGRRSHRGAAARPGRSSRQGPALGPGGAPERRGPARPGPREGGRQGAWRGPAAGGRILENALLN